MDEERGERGVRGEEEEKGKTWKGMEGREKEGERRRLAGVGGASGRGVGAGTVFKRKEKERGVSSEWLVHY